MISFTDFYTLQSRVFNIDSSNLNFYRFIIKALKRAKCFPLLDDYDYSFLRAYCSMLKSYYTQCVVLNKTPCCENNMLREINETAESYSYLKKEFDKAKFKENYAKHLKAWDFSYGDFIVSIPTEPQDLIIEGEKMHHCVGSYVDKVLENKTYIVFIRKKDNIKTPYITAQINLRGQLEQYYLAYDKEINNKEDMEFKKAFQEYLNKVWDLG